MKAPRNEPVSSSKLLESWRKLKKIEGYNQRYFVMTPYGKTFGPFDTLDMAYTEADKLMGYIISRPIYKTIEL